MIRGKSVRVIINFVDIATANCAAPLVAGGAGGTVRLALQ